MSSIVKETESPAPAAGANSAPASTAKPREDAAAKLQPVPIEIGIAVNGARAIEGTDKREPFSESTKTVLVFGHGAVIKLTSNVAPGQLLFVTNEQTRKEVVCQVVKSKAVSNTLVYVELEFTEAAPGFWGMRFPNDHIKAAPRFVAPTAAAAKPVAPVAVKPVAPPAAAPVVAPKPEAPVASEVVAPAVEPVKPVEAAPVAAAPEIKEAEIVEAKAPEAPVVTEAPVAAVVVEAPKPPVAKAPEAPKSGDANTEALRQQAAKLQEQLSSMLFAEQKPAEAPVVKEPSVSVPPAAKSPADQLTAKILEIVEAPVKPSAPPARPAAPVKQSSFSRMAEEETKIPSWLAPLAKESDVRPATESSNAAVEAAEKFPAASAEKEAAEISADAGRERENAGSEESSSRGASPMFGGQLVTDGASGEAAGGGSGKMKWLGIAAGILVLAGGYWYSQQPGNAISGLLGAKAADVKTAAAKSAAVPAAAPASASADSAANKVSNSAAVSSPSVSSAPAPAPEPATTQPPVATVQNQATPSLTPAISKERTSAPATKSNPVVEKSAPPAAKKPSLGNVSLAAPVVNRNAAGQTISNGEPAIDTAQPAGGDPLAGGIATSPRKQPVMPAPIGGDVKNAQVLKTVPPIYPQQARAQHVFGNVQIDALIDEAGNVSTAKVLSGPVLLHSAALVAVKQWKYSPALLDGKPTAVHLTVTVQFHE